MVPLRYSISLDDIQEINLNIAAYNKAISFYEEWIEENGEWEYVEERIHYLTNILCEYMIASEFAKEGARTIGHDSSLYEAVEKDFKEKHPNLPFPLEQKGK